MTHAAMETFHRPPVLVTGARVDDAVLDLVEQINSEHDYATGNARQAIEHARRAGELLLRAKREVGHGLWSKWLEKHISFTARTAQLYMRVAENWPAIEAKNETVSFLTLRKALASIKPGNTASPIATEKPKTSDIYVAKTKRQRDLANAQYRRMVDGLSMINGCCTVIEKFDTGKILAICPHDELKEWVTAIRNNASVLRLFAKRLEDAVRDIEPGLGSRTGV